MSDIDEQHASHIGRVQASFFLSAPGLDPVRITKATGLIPDRIAKRGEERRNYAGDLMEPHEQGFWMMSSDGKVNSKDINDHIGYLLELLLPHQDLFRKVVDEMNGETFFDVLWTSNYLYAGTGPVISVDSIRGMSDLRASIGFDIYQDDQEPDSREE